MAKKEDVQQFLNEFKVKMRVFDIVFRDERKKNSQALLDLEISTEKRRQIIENLVTDDYVDGPLDDVLYGISSMWVFGKNFKKTDIYIKISQGRKDSSVLCISFHSAEFNLTFPLKQ